MADKTSSGRDCPARYGTSTEIIPTFAVPWCPSRRASAWETHASVPAPDPGDADTFQLALTKMAVHTVGRPTMHSPSALSSNQVPPQSADSSTAASSAAGGVAARWFAEEVQPHEFSLRAYLRTRFPQLRDLDDLVQEAFARVVRIRMSGPVNSPKSLLFTTARNAAFDIFRRQKIVHIEGIADLESLHVLEESPDAAESASHAQEIQLVADAIRALPTRCRQVFTLRKIYGLSYREIAEKLNISENTVNAQITMGVERCRQYLVARGVEGSRRS
jgi:RNA polymerase sigma factor (sigma-70 family)